MDASLTETKEQLILKRFMIFEDPEERIDAVIAFGKRWPSLPRPKCVIENRIPQCSSGVWIEGLWTGNCFCLRLEAEIPLLRGFGALLCAVYDGLSSHTLTADRTRILHLLGIWDQLSLARQAGVHGIEDKIRQDFISRTGLAN